MAAATATYHHLSLSFISQNPISKTQQFSFPHHSVSILKPIFISISLHQSTNVVPIKTHNRRRFTCNNSLSSIPANASQYEFSDGSTEIELRLQLGSREIQSSKDIFVDADGTCLTVRVNLSGSFITLIETNQLFDKVKPAETIWYIDEDHLVINLKKQDPELKWPDIVESWESLTAGSMQLLKGTSIYLVGDSTEVNELVARELAVGLGYTPLSTKELLETFSKQTIDSWMLAEGSDSVANGECAVLESLSSHVRAVVATLGGLQGAAARADKWQHLYAGFTIWLSQTEAMAFPEPMNTYRQVMARKPPPNLLKTVLSTFLNSDLLSIPTEAASYAVLFSIRNTDENSAREEARRHVKDGRVGYSNADVVVKLQGWDADHAKSVAQASLSALKRLIQSDKKLPGKKSLYIRLGCRGDWPNIKPPGWDPSAGPKPNASPDTN